ncbi:11312_t:CDS:2 [Entrophospora sp. SA101]|nr:11309_t:CDS:2 [Entrophospora sp. SA101]CAJ0837775.1 11312_t:CDS:2 [Entrophospora sp. SA101]
MSQSDIPIRFYCEVFETFRNLFYDNTITLSDNEGICKAHPRALKENSLKEVFELYLTNLNAAFIIENYKDSSAYNTDGTAIKRVAAYYAKFMKTHWNVNGQYTEKISYPCFLLTLDGHHKYIIFASSPYKCVEIHVSGHIKETKIRHIIYETHI